MDVDEEIVLEEVSADVVDVLLDYLDAAEERVDDHFCVRVEEFVDHCAADVDSEGDEDVYWFLAVLFDATRAVYVFVALLQHLVVLVGAHEVVCAIDLDEVPVELQVLTLCILTQLALFFYDLSRFLEVEVSLGWLEAVEE